MKKIFKTTLAAIVAVTMITLIAVPAFAATPAPNFSSGEYVDLVPFMEEEKYGKQQDEEDGVRMNLTKKNSGYTAKFNSQAVNYGVRFNTDIYNQDSAMFVQCVLDSEQDLWDSDNARIYGGPVIQLGYGKITHQNTDWSGYFSLLFTEQDGIDLRFSDKIGNDLVYLGAITSGLKVNYPDTNSKNRGKKDYLVQIKFSKKDITVWVNGIAVIDGVKLNNLYNSTGAKIPCTVERLEAGIHANATRTTVHDFRLYCLKADAKGAALNTPTNQGSNTGTSSNTVSNNSNTSDTNSNTMSDTTSTDNTIDNTNNTTDNVDNLEVNTDKDYILVRGDEVEFFNWLTPVIIAAIVVFALGAVCIGIIFIVSNKK